MDKRLGKLFGNKHNIVEFMHNLLGSDLEEKCAEQVQMLDTFFNGKTLYDVIKG